MIGCMCASVCECVWLYLQALGQVGRVVNTIQGNSIRVAVNGRRWTLNPRCVFPAPGNALIKENDGVYMCACVGNTIYFMQHAL